MESSSIELLSEVRIQSSETAGYCANRSADSASGNAVEPVVV